MKTFDESEYLRGKEVLVRLAIRKPGDETPPDESCESEWVAIRLTANHVAAIEEEFGGRTAFATAFEERPTWSFLRVLAIFMKRPVVDAELSALGLRMFESERPAYLGAIEAAWHLAHGMEEEDAGKAWRSRTEIVADQTGGPAKYHAELLARIDRDRTGSRGKGGSTNGRSRAAPSKSSGG